MPEWMKYTMAVLWGALMALAAWMLGKQTSVTAEGQSRLIDARLRKNEEQLERIAQEEAETRDQRRREALGRRKKLISEQTQTLTDTQTNLEELLRSRPVDDDAFAREWNRRRAKRRSDTEPNGNGAPA